MLRSAELSVMLKNGFEMDLTALQDLENQYQQATDSIGRIKEAQNGYFDYPEEIEKFMVMLVNEPWVNFKYNPSDINEILENINNATLIQIKTVLTGTSRGERFKNGHWKSTLETKRLDPVFKRLKELANA